MSVTQFIKDILIWRRNFGNDYLGVDNTSYNIFENDSRAKYLSGMIRTKVIFWVVYYSLNHIGIKVLVGIRELHYDKYSPRLLAYRCACELDASCSPRK